MRLNVSGITRASTSHTISSLNGRMTFVTRSSAVFDYVRHHPQEIEDLIHPFFIRDVDLFMRTYIA